MASYTYPFVGGLMLGSCVYHLLSFNGNVLGISGIYGTTIKQVLCGFSKPKEVQKADVPEAPTNYGTASDNTNSAEQTPENVPGSSSGVEWHVAFTAGLFAAGAILRIFRPKIEEYLGVPLFDDAYVGRGNGQPLAQFLSGLVVGVGTKLAGGCTSGHMLCGVSRLSLRSVVATATFFATAVGLTQLRNPSGPSFVPVTLSRNAIILLLVFQLPLLLYRFVIPYVAPKHLYKAASSFVIALHFGFGLALAGMLQPSKIQNFLALPFSPNFDPSLLFVAIGGLLPNLLTWVSYLRDLPRPKFSEKFEIPQRFEIDWTLIVGSVLFGLGWGWLGVCPGPGIVLEGALPDEWKSVGLWLLGLSVGRFLPYAPFGGSSES